MDLSTLTLSGIVAAIAYYLANGGGAIAAWAYDRTLARVHPYFETPAVRAWFSPILASAIVAALGAALVPAEALAGSAFAPLIDAALPFVLAQAGWQGATRAMSQAEV